MVASAAVLLVMVALFLSVTRDLVDMATGMAAATLGVVATVVLIDKKFRARPVARTDDSGELRPGSLTKMRRSGQVDRSSRSRRRYMLCRPCGGLNDMLCQIQRCKEYAMRHDRILYIDGTREGFFDELDHYFTGVSGVVMHSMPSELWTGATIYPDVLSGVPMNYRSETAKEGPRVYRRVVGTDVSLTFDFNSQPSEDIIVHHSSGSGMASHRVWNWMGVEEGLRAMIQVTIDELGEYDAIHIRNTDRKTDYMSFFDTIGNLLGNRIVICTDDPGCREYGKEIWGTRLVPTDFVANQVARPLYYQRLEQDVRRRANVSTLTDLLILASARQLFVGRLQHPYVHRSGFSDLALYLHDNPEVLASILDGRADADEMKTGSEGTGRLKEARL